MKPSEVFTILWRRWVEFRVHNLPQNYSIMQFIFVSHIFRLNYVAEWVNIARHFIQMKAKTHRTAAYNEMKFSSDDEHSIWRWLMTLDDSNYQRKILVYWNWNEISLSFRRQKKNSITSHEILSTSLNYNAFDSTLNLLCTFAFPPISASHLVD